MSGPYWTILIVLLGISSLLGMLWVKSLSFPFRVLCSLVVLTLISTVLQLYVIKDYHDKVTTMRGYTLLNIILIGAVYYTLLNKKNSKRIVLAGTILNALFCIVDSIYAKRMGDYPSYILIMMSMFFVCYAFLSNYEMMHNSKLRAISREGAFWLNSGVLVFYSIAFVYWCLFGYFLRTKQYKLLGDLWYMLWTLNIILYSAYTISMFFNSRRLVNRKL